MTLTIGGLGGKLNTFVPFNFLNRYYLLSDRVNRCMADRGTSSKKPAKETDWVGPKFSKIEIARLKKSGVKYISINRGGGRFLVKDLVAASERDYKGKKSSGRGTSSR